MPLIRTMPRIARNFDSQSTFKCAKCHRVVEKMSEKADVIQVSGRHQILRSGSFSNGFLMELEPWEWVLIIGLLSLSLKVRYRSSTRYWQRTACPLHIDNPHRSFV